MLLSRSAVVIQMSRTTLLTPRAPRRALFVAPLLALTMTLSSVAAAGPPIPAPVKDPPAEDVDRAGELYDNGTGLYNEGSYDGAAMAFIQAYELSGDIDLLYNVSLAYDRAENFEEALRFLEAYRALAPKEERGALGDKVESLKVRLAKKAETDAQAAEDDAATDETDSTPPEDDTDATPSGAATTGGDDRDPGPRVFTPLAGVFTGLAVAGVAVGAGLGLSSRAATNDVEDQCSGPLCQQAASEDIDRAKNRALIADIGFGVGAASAVALIVVLAVNASKRKKARANAWLVPSRRGASVAFSF